MQLILLSAPGAGKGTQAVALSQKLGLCHLASGDVFRQAQLEESELGDIVRTYMEKGELVPDEVTVEVMLKRVAAPDCARGFILDGFPRTLEQAQALENYLAAQGKSITKVLYINIKASDRELIERITGRRVCRTCQAPAHVKFRPPKVPGRCDLCGGELYQRRDDSEEIAIKRLETYRSQTMPLIEHYARAGKLVEVNGEQKIEEVTRDLLAALAVA